METVKTVMSEDLNLTSLSSRLKGMNGNTYMYNAQNYKVQGYSIKGAEVKIHTNVRTIVTSVQQLEEVLDEFLPVEAEANSQVLAVMQRDSGMLNDLEDILMDNIKKVKSDATYLPQAKEINAQANSIIKIAKTKVEMVREIRKATEL